jgi:CheY-like chemotaxis protein
MARILIVDDSRLTRRHIARLLQGEGWETEEADDGRAAIAMAEATPYDCILLDILMPVMDGIQFLDAAGASGLGTPVIVMSADAQTPDRAEQLKLLGARAVVNKPPAGADAIVGEVRRALGETA